MTNGSIDFRDLEKAIQKVFGDRLDEQHGGEHPGTPRRWRSASYWGEEPDDDWEDEDASSYVAYDIEETDIFEDLICMSENNEAQLVFPDELPVVMDEADALDAVAGHIEDVYYETQHRLHHRHKGKGKGKKGKSKSPAHRTYGAGAPSFGQGRGGGYLEHRRLLQQSRNGRGYDRPWQQRQGSKLTLTELKAKTRCHQCKQVGHWSRECPHRSKHASPTSRSSGSTTGMSTGFFVQPPATTLTGGGSFLTTTPELKKSEEYMPAAFLSFCYLAVHEDEGTALVDTAAQHGLVGLETLQRHDHLLQERFGIQVQWSPESGGSVRGVCGKEETTSIAYVPIGLGSCSGVLRVQVVPGTIPFLLPAYFLTNLGAVIDMERAFILYSKIGASQNMKRLSTGHVAVSIIDFGSQGFTVPTTFAASASQAWSVEPVPDWASLPWPADWPVDGDRLAAMGPLAALVAALACIGSPPVLADLPRGPPNSTAQGGPSYPTTPATTGGTSFATGTTGTTCSFRGQRLSALADDIRPADNRPPGGESEAIGHGEGQWEVLGACLGAVSDVQPPPDQTRCQPDSMLSRMHRMPSTTNHAIDPSHGASSLEQPPLLHPGPLLRQEGPEEQDQSQEPEGGKLQSLGQFNATYGTDTKSCSSIDDFSKTHSLQVSSTTYGQQDRDQGGGRARPGHERCQFMVRRGSQSAPPIRSGAGRSRSSDDWRSPRSNGSDPVGGTLTILRQLPDGRSDASSPQPFHELAVEVRQQPMLSALGTAERYSSSCSGHDSLPSLPQSRDVGDCTGNVTRGPGDAVHGRAMRASSLHVRDSDSLCTDWPLQYQPPGELTGWLRQLKILKKDETFQNLLTTLDIDHSTTYVATSCGEVAPGVAPVLTRSILSRKVVMTNDGSQWNAVHVTTVPGEDYQLGARVSYLTLYEFTKDFIDYLSDAELYQHEVTLAKSTKNDIVKNLDGLLHNQSAYWTLWEEQEPDDIVEIFGGLVNENDAIVEIYSPPRLVEAAAKRGLKASLSVDLVTGHDLSQASQRKSLREELHRRRPKLLTTSPPCTKFSPLQNIRPHPERLQEELPEAKMHVDFSMELQEDQLARGDDSLHEHPHTATSWLLPSVERFLSHDQIVLVKAHLCRFGLQVGQGGLNKKATLFATSNDCIAVNLQKLCNCSEPHEPLLSGLPHKAQEYPPELVKAIIDGLMQSWLKDQHGTPRHLPDRGDLEQWVDELLPREFQQWRTFHDSAILVLRRPLHHQVPTRGPGHRTLRWTWAKGVVDGKWLQLERAGAGKMPVFEVQYPFVIVLYHHAELTWSFAESASLTPMEKKMVLRAHVNLGHPGVKEFVRLLKAAGTRTDVIQYVLKEFSCDGCRLEKRQPTRLPAATPRTYDFNVCVGIDLLFVHGISHTTEHPILNVTCLGTLYSTFSMVDPNRRGSELVWNAFLDKWLRVFGAPAFLLMDQGLEFQGHFIEQLESHGIQPIIIDRDAPYQNGVTERRGGLFKEVYYRTRELKQPSTIDEVKNMVHEVAWALQTLTNRSGYSPAQRVFGKQPSLGMDLLSDAREFEYSMTADGAWNRAEEIRKAARQALMEVIQRSA